MKRKKRAYIVELYSFELIVRIKILNLASKILWPKERCCQISLSILRIAHCERETRVRLSSIVKQENRMRHTKF